MNIFHIPSWYPNKKEPLEGIFIKDFIYQFAARHKDSNHIISNQQEYNFSFALKAPGRSLREIAGFLKARKGPSSKSEGNVLTLYTSGTLEYSTSLGFDPLGTLGRKHLLNFEKALQQFGRIDLIHAHVTFPAGIFARQIAEQFHIPYLITEHSGPFPFDFILNNDTYLKELKRALDGASAVVSVSNAHAADVLRYTRTPVTVIFNQVAVRSMPPPERMKDADAFVFLSAAVKLDEKKGIPQLLNAFAAIRNKGGKQPILWLVGDAGPELEAILKAEKLEDNVRLWGRLPPEQLAAVIGQCDAFVLPSRRESFGLVYVEAIMAGKPVIATRCGGPEDIVHAANGVLVPVDDPDALENALLFIMENSNKFDRDRIREDAIRKFSPDAITDRYYKLYHEIVSSCTLKKAT